MQGPPFIWPGLGFQPADDCVAVGVGGPDITETIRSEAEDYHEQRPRYGVIAHVLRHARRSGEDLQSYAILQSRRRSQ